MTSLHYRGPWDTTSAIPVAPVLLAIFEMAGCTSAPEARPATPHQATSANVRDVPDEERGIHLVGDLGFDHTLQVRRSKHDVPHELHDGDTVMTDDRIRVSVQTSEDAHLYLAFCTHQKLAVYPSQGGIRTRAGELMSVPSGSAELVVDGDPGSEVLYVILSRTELSLADPKLAQALAAHRPGNIPTDCATNLDAKPAKPPSNAGTTRPSTQGSPHVLRGEMVRKKPMPSTRQPSDHTPASPTIAAPAGPAFASPAAPLGDPPRDPDFERSPGDIVWYRVDDAMGPLDVVAADEDGIAVVRHAFTHVALVSRP